MQQSEKMEKHPEDTSTRLRVELTDVRNNEDLYHRMISEIEDYAIIFLDKDGIIQTWNKGAEKIKQYKEAEIVGKHFSILYLPEDLKTGLPERLIQEAKEAGSYSQEGWRRRRDGSRFWGSITLTAIHDNRNQVIGFSKITHDLTDKKLIEDRQRINEEGRLLRNEALRKSEERYHKMIAEVQDYAIILLDQNGFIQNWNKGAESIKLYKESEIIGKHFSMFYPVEDQRKGLPQKLMHEAGEKGRAAHEGWRVRKDGSRFWGAITITALHDGNGEIIGYSKVTRDLTERKIFEDHQTSITEELRRRNEELKTSEQLYHQMIAEVQDYAIIFLDLNGNIQNWNAGAEFIKGYSSEVIGKNFNIFYTKEDKERDMPGILLRTAAKEGRAVHEGWRVRKDGSRFWGSIVITALHDSVRKLIGYSKVTRDLTDKKLAEDKLRAYAAELEAQNDELEQFAYVASHDLQEPLRKIQTFTDIIKSNLENEEFVRRYFEKIDESSRRMSELIKSVLNYSRLAKGVTETTVVDLNEIISNINTDFELLIEEKSAVIFFENLPKVNGNPLQLSQLFTNLISNSLKFAETAPQINIQSKLVRRDEVINQPAHLTDENYWDIVVADNGIGFDQQYEKLIFSMFQRLHGKQEYPGTGIGLALCKKIIEIHKGHIAAKGELGKGSEFHVYLPTGIL